MSQRNGDKKEREIVASDLSGGGDRACEITVYMGKIRHCMRSERARELQHALEYMTLAQGWRSPCVVAGKIAPLSVGVAMVALLRRATEHGYNGTSMLRGMPPPAVGTEKVLLRP